MGIEYRGTFAGAPPDRSTLDATLRSRDAFSGFDPAFASYDFRLASNPSVMPNVAVRIVFEEHDAERVRELYVCDYGDDGTILRDLESALCASFEEIE